jgi:LacI family transcriptional regulator
MRRRSATTLSDVAREAGVSAMVASVVLNNATSSTRVSEATRDRILEAAKRMQYRPNAVARGLSRRRMNTIGVSFIIHGGDFNHYLMEILNGILETAAQYQQNTTIFSISDWTIDEPKILQACDGRIDGMILIGPPMRPSFVRQIPRHTPFVFIHNNSGLPNVPSLDVDNENGSYDMTKLLLNYGHRCIAHITGSMTMTCSRERQSGYLRALQEKGIKWDEDLTVLGDFTIERGRECTLCLLQRLKNRPLPTAILCDSDAIAFGCIEVLNDHGIRVPEDISVTGFDDTHLAQITNPPLTTVRQPFGLMAKRAVEILLSHVEMEPAQPENHPVISNNGDETDGHLILERLPHEIIIRSSVCAPRETPLIA